MLKPGHYGNMRRHYKMKHPYIFYKESQESKKKDHKSDIDKYVDTTNDVNGGKINNEFVDIGSIETIIPKTIISQRTRKKRSALWRHFEDLDKTFIRCKLCEMKLRDKHHIAVMHLSRRHSKEFANLDDFNIMPFQQRNNLLWTFFTDEGNRFVRCKLCNATMRKNMSRHLQTEHPDDFDKAMSCKRAEIEKYYEQPPPKNWIKRYCTKIADKQHRCNECGLVLKLPDGLYGNMRRHVKNKHPNIYYAEMRTEKPEKVNAEAKMNFTDVSKANDSSNTSIIKDPLADFDLGSPVMTETEMAASFIQGDNLESSLCSGIDLDAIVDLPVLGPSCESESYDKSYFMLVEDGHYKCIQCDETVNCPDVDEQEALFTHIRDKHPEEIMTLQATSIETDDEYHVVVLGNLDVLELLRGTQASYSPVLLSTDVIIDEDQGIFRFNVSRRDLIDRVTPTAETILDEGIGRFCYLMLIPILYADQPTAVWFRSKFNLHYRVRSQSVNREPLGFERFPFPPPLPPPPPPAGSPPPSPPPTVTALEAALADGTMDFILPMTPPMPPTPPPVISTSKCVKPKSLFMKRLEKEINEL